MGRKAEISDQEIIAAGERLESAKHEVNGWSLRRALGNRGKPERLLAVWHVHIGLAEDADAIPPALDIAAQALRQATDRVLLELWQSALTEAGRQLRGEIGILQRQLLLAEEAITEAESRAEAAEGKAEVAAREYAALATHLETARQADASSRERIRGMEEALAAAKGKMAVEIGRADGLAEKYAQSQEALKHREQALAEATEQLNQQRREIAVRDDERQKETERRCTAEGRLSALERQIESLEAQGSEMNQRLEAERQAASETIASLREETATARSEAILTARRSDHEQPRIEAFLNRIETLLGQMQRARSQNEKIKPHPASADGAEGLDGAGGVRKRKPAQQRRPETS